METDTHTNHRRCGTVLRHTSMKRWSRVSSYDRSEMSGALPMWCGVVWCGPPVESSVSRGWGKSVCCMRGEVVLVLVVVVDAEREREALSISSHLYRTESLRAAGRFGGRGEGGWGAIPPTRSALPPIRLRTARGKVNAQTSRTRETRTRHTRRGRVIEQHTPACGALGRAGHKACPDAGRDGPPARSRGGQEGARTDGACVGKITYKIKGSDRCAAKRRWGRCHIRCAKIVTVNRPAGDVAHVRLQTRELSSERPRVSTPS